MYRKIFVFIIYFGWIILAQAKAALPPIAFKKIEILPYESGIKIKIRMSGSFTYRYFKLPAKKKNFLRFVIDTQPVYLPKGMKKNYVFSDPRIKKVRVAQFNKKTVRIVIYLKKAFTYKINKKKHNLILFINSPLLKKLICIRSIKVTYPPPQGFKVIIKTTGKPHYKDFILPAISYKNLPPRLVIDLWPAYLPRGIKKKLKLSHPLVSGIRLAQFNKKTVRIVFYLKTTKIPYNLSFVKSKLILTAFDIQKPSISLPQVLGLKVKKIVIDPGHGGKDPGAIGYYGLKEKDITLRVARLLKKKLETQLGCEVFLTRNQDKYVSLEKRAEFANKINADLFISIHCNACASRRLQGIETYFVGLTDDTHALAVASRENASLSKRMGELEKILQDLLVRAKIKESAYMAAEIQRGIIKFLTYRGFNPVVNLGVKQAPFYVLIGTKMPAVLVEIGFIDHPKEAKRLRNPKYLVTLVDGISKGIKDYISTIEATYRYKSFDKGG